MSKEHKDTIQGTIRHNWAAIVVIVGLITAWANINSLQAQQDERIATNSGDIKNITELVNDVNLRLTRIEANVDFIKENIKK